MLTCSGLAFSGIMRSLRMQAGALSLLATDAYGQSLGR